MNIQSENANIRIPLHLPIFAVDKRKNNMKKLLVTLTLACSLLPLKAQQVLTLEECLQTGIENNLSLRSRQNEIRKGKHSISENRAKLLPQINAIASFNDNFNPPVSVTDGSAYGNPYNVTHTLQYNASAGLQLQMPLYNQTIYTAVSIAKTMDEINQLSYEKAREDLIIQIASMYYLGQSTAEQIELIKENIARLEELKNITVAFYDNGMAMEVDVKRVNINLENQQVQYDNAVSMLTQQLNMLKYVIDYPAEKEIALTPVDAQKITLPELDGLSEELYELQLLRTQSKLMEQQKKMVTHGYLPSLNLTGNLMYSAFTDKGYHWFHSGPSNHWYQSSGIGISLRIPIFDGLEKRAKQRKARIDIENIKLSYENTLKNFQVQYLNATNDLMNNERNFVKQKNNYQLAEDVYTVTSDRYKEGIASMTEVLQDEMRMSEAQNNYVTAHYNYRISNLKLLKLTGKTSILLK